MKKNLQRLFAVFLSILFVCSPLASAAYADGDAEQDKEKAIEYTEEVFWLVKDGTLYISGAGEITVPAEEKDDAGTEKTGNAAEKTADGAEAKTVKVGDGEKWTVGDGTPDWLERGETAEPFTTVTVCGEIVPKTVEGWFSGCKQLSAADLTGLKITEDTVLTKLFDGCTGLTEITLTAELVKQIEKTTLPVPAEEAGYDPHWHEKEDGSDAGYGDLKSMSGSESLKFYAVRCHTIVWLDEDGTELAKTTVKEGETPVYPGSTPGKESTDTKSYTFDKWTPEIGKAERDATYTATYTESDRVYTVTVAVSDASCGTVDAASVTVLYGTEIAAEDNTLKIGGKTVTATAAPEAEGYSYAFKNWEGAEGPVTGDMTVTAVFERTELPESYTVTWKNEDGTVLETDTQVAGGSTPEYNGATPEKTASAQYAYTFDKWDPEVRSVSGDVTDTATYTEELRSYTVTIVTSPETGYGSVDVQKLENVPYGTTITANRNVLTVGTAAVTATPAEKDGEYEYTFSGWKGFTGTLRGDLTVTAAFTRTGIDQTATFTVTWKNADGTVIEIDKNVREGTTPEFNGGTPVKPADAQYTYTFKEWSPAPAGVKADTTYTAVYSQTVNRYEVKFLRGTEELYTATVNYGDKAVYGGSSTDIKGYSFAGWYKDSALKQPFDLSKDTITGKTTLYGKWTPVYTITGVSAVTWNKGSTGTLSFTCDGSAEKLTGIKVDGNKIASKYYTLTEKTCTAALSASYLQTLSNGKHSLAFVFSDGESGTATFTVSAQQNSGGSGSGTSGGSSSGGSTSGGSTSGRTGSYTIKWVNDDGTVLETDSNVAAGKVPEYNGKTPEKADDGQYSYTFKGWSPAVTAASYNATYTATFTKTENKFTVTFYEGTKRLYSASVAAGSTASYRGPTTVRVGYNFAGWYKDSAMTETFDLAKEKISGDMSVYGKWIPVYTVKNASDGNWNRESEEPLEFSCNGADTDFTGLKVDGQSVDPQYYTVTEGSTIVALKPEYLATLSTGAHTVLFEYKDGESDPLTFTVTEDVSEEHTETQTRSGWIIIAAIAVLLAGGGGFAYYYLIKKKGFHW